MKYLKIKKDAAGNLDDVNVKQADLAGHADSADSAGNVSQTINGKSITSIFEADGTTARLAIKANSAENVASTINLKKITDIFESDGLKAKKATAATKLETARSVRTNLASTNAASFDGTANITPGVSGVLPLANGGIGATSLDGANIVTKNTQQTITGQKKFNDYALVLNDHADFLSSDIDVFSAPNNDKFVYFQGKDKYGRILGSIGFMQHTDGRTGAYLQANRGDTWGGNLGIRTKEGTSDVYAYAPNPPFDSKSDQIATTYWVREKLAYRKSLYSSTSVTTGQKTIPSIIYYDLLLFVLKIGSERFPFLVPKTELVARNSNTNKLALEANSYSGNRFMNLYYVSVSALYFANVTAIDGLEIYGF